MALRVSMLVGALAVPYAVALRLTRRAAIAQITAAAAGCVDGDRRAGGRRPHVGRFARNEGAKEFVGRLEAGDDDRRERSTCFQRDRRLSTL